jgi:hypothetical protein
VTSPHHIAKNQSFFMVPFHPNHSKIMPSMKRSKDKSTKKPKTHKRNKLSVFMLFFLASKTHK